MQNPQQTEFDFHSIFDVDFKSGKLIWRNPPKNRAHLKGKEAGYINTGTNGNKTYWQVRAFNRTFKRSRVIYYMYHGKFPNPCVDHINGDSLDDSIQNLREATLSLNSFNCKNRTKTKGVYRTRVGNFIARITKDGKTINLGTYENPDDACAAYANAAVRMYPYGI